jgi:trans-aconitate methyltransferase
VLSIIKKLNLKTDKETSHNYLSEVYEKIFLDFKFKKINILEVGVSTGHSLILWHEFFPKVSIYGIDNELTLEKEFVKPFKRIKVVRYGDAYLKSTLSGFPDFDIAIDDASHYLHDQIKFMVNLYLKLNKDGIMLIEDIRGSKETLALLDLAKKLKLETQVFDLRLQTRNSGSIILVCRKLR